MQKEDEAIAQVIYWAGTSDETIDMASFGMNLIPKKQAIQYGPVCRLHQSAEGKQKRAAGEASFDPGIRFTTVDILGPVTRATSTGARLVLVMTDLFPMYAIAVHLVTTDSA